MSIEWTPSSWRHLPIKHVPDYPDKAALARVEQQLADYPGLIAPEEARELKSELAKVARGEAFLLQGGDCAESFAEHSQDHVQHFFQVFLQMAVILTFAGGRPVVKIGRIAGQFAKPRSDPFEVINGEEMMTYRGDIINDVAEAADKRQPDPERMLQAYGQSAATLNLLRAFATGGYADLARAAEWRLDFLKNSEKEAKYLQLARKVTDSLDFMRACEIGPHNTPQLRSTRFFTSHEALLLGYEEALTRKEAGTDDYYATSGHFLWVGDRTRQYDNAHIHFLSQIKNPLGLKCGPTLEVDDMIRLIKRLNPDNEFGRLTLICRFGADNVEAHLPQMIRAVKREGLKVGWSCDPMHGNTIKSASKIKTRPFERIAREIRQYFAVHEAENSWPGGIHVEMTGSNVTECTGGICNLTDEDLHSRYRTHCDPRLNAEQALELAFDIADRLHDPAAGQANETPPSIALSA